MDNVTSLVLITLVSFAAGLLLGNSIDCMFVDDDVPTDKISFDNWEHDLKIDHELYDRYEDWDMYVINSTGKYLILDNGTAIKL